MPHNRKRRRLKNIHVDEVSWVDNPANQIPFLFFKSLGDTIRVEKEFKSVSLTFEAKDSPQDTKLTINGKDIADPTGLSLFYSPMGDDKVSIFLEYSQDSTESKDGFKTTTTNRLVKNKDGIIPQGDNTEVQEAAEEDLEVLKCLLGVIPNDIDASLAKALSPHVEKINIYGDDLPADLAEAVKQVVKLAANTVEDIEVEKNEMVDEVKPLDMDKLVETVVESVVPKVTESVLAGLAAVKEAEAKVVQEKAEQEAAELKAKEEADMDDISAEDMGNLMGEAVIDALQDSSADKQ